MPLLLLKNAVICYFPPTGRNSSYPSCSKNWHLPCQSSEVPWLMGNTPSSQEWTGWSCSRKRKEEEKKRSKRRCRYLRKIYSKKKETGTRTLGTKSLRVGDRWEETLPEHWGLQACAPGQLSWNPLLHRSGKLLAYSHKQSNSNHLKSPLDSKLTTLKLACSWWWEVKGRVLELLWWGFSWFHQPTDLGQVI